jgi:hypothetical protein
LFAAFVGAAYQHKGLVRQMGRMGKMGDGSEVEQLDQLDPVPQSR